MRQDTRWVMLSHFKDRTEQLTHCVTQPYLMPTDTTGQDNNAEGQQQVAMPTTNQPAEAVVTQQEQSGQLPEDASERTKAEFEKLKEHNKQLAEKLKQLETPVQPQQSVLDSLIPQQNVEHLSQTQIESEAQKFVDKDGYVDVDALNRSLADLNRQAKEATERARRAEERIAKFEQTEEVTIAHSKHPYLDPYNPNFDQKFYNLVRNEVIGQMINGEQNLLKAADKVKKELYDPEPIRAQAQAQEKEKQQDAVEKRSQAGFSTSSQKAGVDPNEQADLVTKTRKGDINALYKRLQANGY